MTLEEILQLHKSGEFDAAEAAYREHVLGAPDDADAMHLLGVLRQRRGASDEAAELIARAIQIEPERAQYHLSLGGVLMDLGDTAAARGSFETALALDPNDTQAHGALGHLLLLDGEIELAEQRFKIARHAEEEDPIVLLGLGNVHLARKDPVNAVKYLSRAAERSPKDAAIQASFGRALFANGADTIALQAFENALALDPGMHTARLMLGVVSVKLQRLQQAQECFEQLLAARACVAAATAGLGDIARAGGDVHEAIHCYRRALALDPAMVLIAMTCADGLRQLGKVQEAIQCLRSTLNAVPDAENVRNMLVDLLEQSGEKEAAVVLWRDALTRFPDDIAIRSRYAAALEAADHWDDASAEAARICTSEPGNIGANLILVRAQLRDGDGRGASGRLEEIASKQPRPMQSVQRLRGFAEDLRGHHAQAVSAWLSASKSTANVSRRWPLMTPAPPKVDGILPTTSINDALAPIFLLGAPGSGVERIAALLSDQAELTVLTDRFGSEPRQDDFTTPHFSADLIGADADATALHFARRYRRGLLRIGFDARARIVDWLPNWDARLLPLMRRAMPAARFIVVERSAKATLLNWLAFGGLPGFGFGDPVQDAAWLHQRLLHQGACANSGFPICRVAASAVFANPAAATDLAATVAIPQLGIGVHGLRAKSALGGLPLEFADARVDDYAAALSAPFSMLSDV